MSFAEIFILLHSFTFINAESVAVFMVSKTNFNNLTLSGLIQPNVDGISNIRTYMRDVFPKQSK